MLSNTLIRKGLFLCLLFLSSIIEVSLASNSMEWGEIPSADLLMKRYDKDTSANAVILGDLGKLSVYSTSRQFEYYLIRHRRIKIINKKGFDWADVAIPIRDIDETEALVSIKAQIFNPSGKKTELNRKDFHREKINDRWSWIKFTFPNVEEGAVIEYTLNMTSKNIIQLNTWYFHNEIPTRLSELQITVEGAFTYATLFQGAEQMEKTELRDGTTLLKSGDTKMRLKPGHYVMENAPAFKEEAFITNIDDYRARIRFQLQEVTYPDGFKQSFMASWEELSKNLMDDQIFGLQFRKKKNFKKILESIEPKMAKASTPMEIINTIYDFVGRNLKWNGKYGLYPDEGLNRVFEKKLGKGVELNLITLALLNHFEINAYPLLCSTRSYGNMLRDYPIVEQFNHVMVLVDAPDGDLIIDIPDEARPMGLPDVNSLNSYAFLVDEKNPEWISISAPLGTDSYRSLIKITEEGVLECQMNMNFTNYNAIIERSNYRNNMDGTYWKKRLEERLPGVKLDRFEVKYLEESGKPFINNLIFTGDAGAQQIGDFIYLSPVLYTNISENPFKQEVRYYPVDFPYPFEEKYVATVLIPEGYVLDEVPEEVNFQLGRNAGFFTFKPSVKENVVQLSSHLRITELKVAPENYARLKKMLDIMIEKQAEQIVLRKK